MPRQIALTPWGKGINQFDERTQMPNGFVWDSKNMSFSQGKVSKRGGYQLRSAVKMPLAGTTYDITAVNTGTETFTVAEDISSLVAGDIIEVSGSTGNDQNWTVASTSGTGPTVITVSGNITDATVDGVISITNQVIREIITFQKTDGTKIEVWIGNYRVYTYTLLTDTRAAMFQTAGAARFDCFSGGDDGWISWTLMPHTDGTPRIVFTDGKEFASDHTLYVWNGVTNPTTRAAAHVQCDDANDWFTVGEFAFCKQVIWFSDHLMVGNYGDNSQVFNQGIVWSDTLAVNFDKEITDDGNQGDIILADAKGAIVRFIKLGSHLAVYCENSIVICDRVPTSSVFDFDVRVQGIGLAGPGAVTDIGGLHIFLGEDNVYFYDGGLHPRPIGTRIIDKLLAIYDDTKANRIAIQHDRRRFRVNLFIPSSSDTYPSHVFSYNYLRDTWAYWQMLNGITGIGEALTGGTAKRFNDALFTTALGDGSFERFNGFYGQFAFGDFAFQDSRIIPVAGSDDFYVLDFSLTTPSERGNEISATFETELKPLGESYGEWGRITEIEVRYKGSGFALAYQVEEDAEWITLDTFPDHTGFSVHRQPLDIVGEFIGFRVSTGAQSAALEITVLSVTVVPWGSRALDGN